MVAAWFNTSLEHEKSLLTLSSAGIALLISITLKGDLKPLLALVFYGVALWSFVVCLITVLWIYRQNRPHLEAIVASRASTSRLLTILDVIALCSFLAGIMSASILGFCIAIHAFSLQERPVTAEDKGSPKTQVFNDSFNRAINMQTPVDPLAKSFSGAGKMQTPETPQAVKPTTAPSPTPPAPSPSTTSEAPKTNKQP